MRTPPSWSQTWMEMARLISTRSKDPSFAAGSVLVANDQKSLLGTGFNGPPPSISDDFDWADRDLKRSLTSHAESNCLWFAVAAHGPEALRGGWLFVNGRPCSQCAKEIARAELWHVVWDDLNPSQPQMVDGAEWAKTIDILNRAKVDLIPYSSGDY